MLPLPLCPLVRLKVSSLEGFSFGVFSALIPEMSTEPLLGTRGFVLKCIFSPFVNMLFVLMNAPSLILTVPLPLRPLKITLALNDTFGPVRSSVPSPVRCMPSSSLPVFIGAFPVYDLWPVLWIPIYGKLTLPDCVNAASADCVIARRRASVVNFVRLVDMLSLL